MLIFLLNLINLKGTYMNSNRNIPSRIYFKKHIQQLVNLNIQTIRRMWQRGNFPTPIMINGRCAWHADVIDQWLNSLGGNHG